MTAQDLYGIGVSGAKAYQAALGVISNNIANTDTPGYSRRMIELKESPAGSGVSIFYNSGMAFGGAMIGKIVRMSDDYLDTAARATGTTLASADQRARWMADIQTALNDGSLGVGQRMTSMFASVERLAANPTDTTLRANVLFSFEQINTAFKQSRTDLVTIRDSIGQAANNEVAALNDALKQLADANEGLRRTPDGTAAHVALLDSRDQALTEITKRLNVDISFAANDVANIKYGGVDLVQNVSAGLVTVAQAADGTLTFQAGADAGSLVAVAAPSSGALAGLAISAAATRDQITKLDTLAADYVTTINTWHTAGRTAGGVAGGNMLAIGADASTLSVLITNPADIAGASAGGVANGNLVAITALRGGGGLEDKWINIISTHGNVVNATYAEQSAAESRNEMAQAARADVSGINLDREAADLMRFQQAYQACARIIQVANTVMDSLFAVIR